MMKGISLKKLQDLLNSIKIIVKNHIPHEMVDNYDYVDPVCLIIDIQLAFNSLNLKEYNRIEKETKPKKNDFQYLRQYYDAGYGCGTVFNNGICRSKIKSGSCQYLKELRKGFWFEH